MPESLGPYLNYALLCERVLREADGVVSFIRAVDRINVLVPVSASDGTPATRLISPVALTLAVGLKSGDYVGPLSIKVRIEPPSGVAWPEFETSLRLEGEDQGAAIILPFQFPAQDEGLYWFAVEVSGEVVTRVPLRVVRTTADSISPPQLG